MILTFTHKDIALIAEKFISDKLSLYVKNYLFFLKSIVNKNIPLSLSNLKTNDTERNSANAIKVHVVLFEENLSWRENQNFLVRVRLLPMCRGELSVVIARLMSKCLRSGWKR